MSKKLTRLFAQLICRGSHLPPQTFYFCTGIHRASYDFPFPKTTATLLQYGAQFSGNGLKLLTSQVIDISDLCPKCMPTPAFSLQGFVGLKEYESDLELVLPSLKVAANYCICTKGW